MLDDPAPNDAPTPPQGVPAPYYPPSPWPQSGTPSSPWPQQSEGLPPPTQYPPQPRPDPSGWSQQPSYLDTPAPPVPVVNRADVEKPPADFDG